MTLTKAEQTFLVVKFRKEFYEFRFRFVLWKIVRFIVISIRSLAKTKSNFHRLSNMSFHYSQPNIILPELDNDPAILKVIHDGERLERETYRKELLQILKIQPKTTTTTNETIPTPPESQTGSEQRTNLMSITPNSKSYRRQNYRSTLHQRSLNSSVESFSNRSFIDSPRSGQQSFIKSARSDTNLCLSPSSMNKMSPIQTHGKSNNNRLSSTPSGTIVTDYRQSSTMKRIVNPQWNIIPFA